MAQTRKRRRTKHRGNAAGVVEARGRTGRRPTQTERRGSASDARRSKAQERASQPPTWRGAINRALLAALIMFPIAVFLLRMPAVAALSLLPVIVVFYVPLGYYTDLFMYRRRMRQREAR